MKKLFDELMFEDFKMFCPWSKRGVVRWKTFDKTQIIVELDDGSKILYDYLDKTFRNLHPIVEGDNEEECWRYEFSQRLRTKMRQRAVRQEILSEETGISRPMISHYMNGKSLPSIYNVMKIARALHCTVEELMHFPK